MYNMDVLRKSFEMDLCVPTTLAKLNLLDEISYLKGVISV